MSVNINVVAYIIVIFVTQKAAKGKKGNPAENGDAKADQVGLKNST